MKTTYKDPQMEVVCFPAEDVVKTSGDVPVTPIDPPGENSTRLYSGWN